MAGIAAPIPAERVRQRRGAPAAAPPPPPAPQSAGSPGAWRRRRGGGGGRRPPPASAPRPPVGTAGTARRRLGRPERTGRSRPLRTLAGLAKFKLWELIRPNALDEWPAPPTEHEKAVPLLTYGFGTLDFDRETPTKYQFTLEYRQKLLSSQPVPIEGNPPVRRQVIFLLPHGARRRTSPPAGAGAAS